jgi:glyoxylase-like metal-dependent hydrolase (beta-lactamase superfamily II)
MTATSGFHPHRRQVLAGIGAALAAPMCLVPRVRAAVAPFRRNVGSIDVMVVSDGILNLPLSFTFPETPSAEATALLAANGLPTETLRLQTNATLVKSGNELVLIDAGSGSNFQDTAGKLAENLEAADLDPAKITKIVFTHGHADHLWGAIDDFDNSERFPNASYVISPAEWDFWTDPNTVSNVPDRFKGMAQGAARVLKRLENKIERRKSGDAVAPGLTYVETNGHTPGHMSVMIESGGEHLLIAGDVLNYAAISFAKPEWRAGNDHDRDQAVVTRKRILDQLATDRLPLVGFHLPWPGHGMVEKSGAAYRFVPV